MSTIDESPEIKPTTRSKIVINNILGSVLIKGISILVTLYLVPVTVKLLDDEKYGVWLTLFSIVNWFNMMDVGLGNGFRNRFTEAIAVGNKKAAKAMMQTFYSTMGILSAVIFFVYLVAHPFLNWRSILNISGEFDENIDLIVLVTVALFCVQIYFKNVSTVLLALQKTALSNFLFLAGNILSLLGVLLLDAFHRTSLFNVALVYMITPNLVLILASVVIFKNSLKEFIPLPFKISKSYLNGFVGLGLKFFFIQIATIVMFSADNILITQLFRPADVTPYNISYRLFMAAYTGFTIIMSPFWSAFTDAGIRNDRAWIIKSVNKLILLWAVFALGLIGILMCSEMVFRLWLGTSVHIPYELSLQFCIFTILLSWTSIFANYLNGIGKIKLQLYVAIFQCLFNIPLAIFLSRYVFSGTVGIIISTNINLLLAAIILPFQVYKILKKEQVNGIWYA